MSCGDLFLGLIAILFPPIAGVSDPSFLPLALINSN